MALIFVVLAAACGGTAQPSPSARASASSEGDFSGPILPAGWNVLLPDQSRWRFDNGALLLQPSPERGRFRYGNTLVHPLPAGSDDLDVTVNFRAAPSVVEDQQFWMNLRAGEEMDGGAFEVGVLKRANGPAAYSWHWPGPANTLYAPATLDGDSFLRISRRGGVDYSSFVSSDGRAWTPVATWKASMPLSYVGLAGQSETGEFAVTIYWLHVDRPAPADPRS